MNNECEYRRGKSEIAEAIRRKGVPSGVKGCARPGENADHLCDFPEIINSSECLYILLHQGKITEEQFMQVMLGC